MESYLSAEVSASALRANMALLRKQLAPGVKLCACVKSDCYGHGLRAILDAIVEGADCLAVATPSEALLLRELNYAGPILVFFSACAHTDAGHLDAALTALILERVTLTVVSADEVAPIGRAARQVGVEAEVHVMVDSGMTRSGAACEAVRAIVARIGQEEGVSLRGLYTHFATADEADKTFAREQLARFQAVAASCGAPEGVLLHAANSAAVIDLPESHLGMVRPGIALYGYQPSDEMHNKLPLRPVLRLTGKLMQIKAVAAGTRCGYGLTYTFDRPGVVGLVPVGYGDGYFRCLSNRATMRVRGVDAAIRGRVSMDQTIVDLGGCPDAAIGDEVEIISPRPDDPHSVENLAKLAGTIPYEITTSLGRRVRRVLAD